MRALFLLPILLAAPAEACVVHVPSEPGGYVDGTVPAAEYEPFVEPLAAYGRWFVYDGYGWVWTPTVVSPDWRPYTVGRWIWTDLGWMWMSDEPWGWATFHYGRWFYDGGYGWIWVPDSVWGPSWVCWRSSTAFYGWAPLPPGVVVFDRGCDPWIGGWIFIDTVWFLSPDVHVYVVPPARNVYVYDRTSPSVETSTSRTPTGREMVVPRGPDPAEVESRTGRSVPRFSLDDIRGETNRLPLPPSVDGDRVRVTRPEFPRALEPSRVEPSSGGKRLDAPPVGGSHRPEVRPSSPPREIPADKRGPKIPKSDPTPQDAKKKDADTSEKKGAH